MMNTTTRPSHTAFPFEAVVDCWCFMHKRWTTLILDYLQCNVDDGFCIWK